MHRRACGIGNFAATATLLDPRHGNSAVQGYPRSHSPATGLLRSNKVDGPAAHSTSPLSKTRWQILYTYRFAPITRLGPPWRGQLLNAAEFAAVPYCFGHCRESYSE
jgi:hypothetical protein